jgi:hypothetical protein
MSFLAIKAFLKKTWVWFKKNWYAPVVVLYTLVLWVVFRRGDKAYEVLQARDQSYKAQIKAINDAHDAEIAERNKVIKKYTEIISALEKQYADNKLVLESKKKKEIKKIVEEYKDDPAGLAKVMSEKFGFVYAKKEEA